MPDDPIPRFFVLDARGRLYPISNVANGEPIGEVVNPQDVASDVPALSESPSDVVLAFLDALDPAEVERLAMARLGMGDATNAGPTRHILDVLKELATP